MSPHANSSESSCRRALVLSGGGAKGAYAFGCLRAFDEYGVVFRSVSGTSVGALNAILWSSGELKSGEELWRNISFSNTYTPRLSIFKLRPLITLVSTLYVVYRLVLASCLRVPIPVSPTWPFSVIAAAVFCCPILAICFVYYYFTDGPFILFGVIAAGPSIYFTWRTLQDRRSSLFLMLSISWMAISSMMVVDLVYRLGTVTEEIMSWEIRGWGVYGVFMAYGTLCFLPILGLLWLTMHLVRYLGESEFSVLRRSPLGRTITEILSECSLRIPVHVTTARMAEVWDPDNPEYVDGVPATSKYPDTSTDWIPEYVMLNDLEVEEAIQFTIASAALPFGIVRSVQIRGQVYVDGGVADNVPVLPVAREADEVWVVLLSRYMSTQAACESERLTSDRLREIQRKIDVASFPIPDVEALSDVHEQINNNTQIIEMDDTLEQPRVMYFYPEAKGLGGLLSGTLNFKAKYAKDIMEQGYGDTCTRLERLGWKKNSPG